MRKKIDKAVGFILVVLMVLMTLDVLWGVITRYLLGSQADWTEELVRFLLIWVGILGAAYAAGQRMHLAIDLLKPKLSLAGRRRVTIILSIFIILFAITVFIIGGSRLMYITYFLDQHSPALRFPMTWVYAVVPLSGVLIVYYKVSDLLAPEDLGEPELGNG